MFYSSFLSREKRALFFFLSLSLLIWNPDAEAIDNANLGSSDSALAGAVVASDPGAFSSFNNPGALALTEERKIRLSFGFVFVHSSFKPIDQIITQNSFNSEVTTGNEVIGNVDVRYNDTVGQVFGVSVHPFPHLWNLSFGLATFTPVPNLVTLDSGETFIPEYFMYRSRGQIPEVSFALGARPTKSFGFGLGLKMTFSTKTDSTLFLATSTGKTSTIRQSGEFKPRYSPYLGLLYSSDSPENTPGGWQIGFVFRPPVRASSQNEISVAAEAISGLAAPDFIFNAGGAIAYDPFTLELGASLRHSERFRSYVQIDYQDWTKFEPPHLLITDANGGVLLVDGANPGFQFKRIWIPRIGEEISIGRTTLRLGYSYRPSILKRTLNENGNYIDPDKHMVSLGAGYQFQSLFGFEQEWELDIHFAYHHLVSGSVTKASSNAIGAPGYSTGGQLFGGGASMKLAF